MRNVPVGIRIPQPEQVLGVEFVDNLIYDSHKPEQAFAVSAPDIGEEFVETFPSNPDSPTNLQVSMTGSDANLSWTKTDN
jgi:hypothetical protein